MDLFGCEEKVGNYLGIVTCPLFVFLPFRSGSFPRLDWLGIFLFLEAIDDWVESLFQKVVSELISNIIG